MKNDDDNDSIEEVRLESSEEEEPVETTQNSQLFSQQELESKEPKKDVLRPNVDLFASHNLKCKCGNDVFLYCCSQNCKQTAIICKDEESPCYDRHSKSKCFNMILAKNFYQNLNSKVINNEDISTKISEEVQKIIDKMTDTVSQLNEQLNEKFKSFGLNSLQASMIEAIKRKVENPNLQPSRGNIFGPPSFQLLNGTSFQRFNTEQKNAQNNWFTDSLTRFQNVVKSTKQTVDGYFDEIDNLLVSLHVKYDKHTNFCKNFIPSKIFPVPKENNGNFGEILYLGKMLNKNHVQFDSIKKIFTYKNVKLNTTDSTPFDFKKLSSSIRNKSNLLFLVENGKQKYMGCFVPNKISLKNQLLNIPGDKYRQPFFFTLNCNVSHSVLRQKFWVNYDQNNKAIEFGEFVKKQKGSQSQKVKRLRLSLSQPNPNVELVLKEEKLQVQKGNPLKNEPMKTVEIEVNYKEVNGDVRSASIFGSSAQSISCLEVYEVNMKSQEEVEKVQQRIRGPVKNMFSSSSVIFGSSNIFSSRNSESTQVKEPQNKPRNLFAQKPTVGQNPLFKN